MLIPVIRYFPIYFVNLSLAEKSDKGNKFAIGMTLLPWYFYGLLSLDKIDEKYSKLQ